ncbi:MULTISPECIES: MalY/PatB family protein [Lactobacillus]|uniref:cysteine-S-conjugate beta-lyase n=1 Tax=Lactobacillus xujianguonis TaxID=2495899 RepID=A0A437SSQ9_9LACO|nr:MULTISPECIES: aminotransferase class I/II-fold pyridoxal phosphate-dependent enzyme [Lactobacillus]RVU69963.1 aminotransferase class I/II-fold pyridoxal phosphate-dependent enzyme [Lactobacillus xujianguonis]RVU72350.1 aminotransferase class I/II-fold pyridoxal phosphate-dependent enzyme [Lactobacillus xujianguonis]
MKYDFTKLIDRHGHDAFAVDAIGSVPGFAPAKPRDGFDTIPMWVADMNFPTAKSIQDEIVKRVEHPLFGYFTPSDDYYQAIIDWHRDHKGVTDLQKEDIGYENSVLGGVVSALKAFAAPGDKVLLHSPAYMGFINSLKDNGYQIVDSPLIKDENGVWRMDYEDMEQKIKENQIHITIFCNPHNPTGRVWTKEEISRAIKIFERNDVLAISDEIWSDLLMNGHHYTPTQSVSEWAKQHTAAFYAPSKTFNLAGLVGSYSVIYNKTIREKVQSIGAKTHYNSMNVLSEHALIGAYSEEGNNWLEQLLPVLSENVNFAYEYVQKNFEGVSTFETEGTYMMFIDCSGWLKKHGKTQAELLERGWEYGIGWQDGKLFEGPTSIRLNLASPTYRIKDAFERMNKYVFNDEW